MLFEKPWRIEAVIRLLLFILLSLSVGAMIASLLTQSALSRHIGNVKFMAFAAGTLTFHIATLCFIRSFLRQHQIGWSKAFGFFVGSLRRPLALASLVSLIVLPIAWTLGELSAQVLTRIHIEPKEQQAVQTLKVSASWEERFFFGIIAVILAPLVEELLFRGIIYPALKQQGYRRVALWGTSLLFALSHFNFASFIALTFLALMLTFLYEETNTLFAPILTHSLFNAANFYWLLRQQGLGPGN